MADAHLLVLSLLHCISLLVTKKWSKVVALLGLGLLFTGMAVVSSFCFIQWPLTMPFWTALTIGLMLLGAISFLACIINVCIAE